MRRPHFMSRTLTTLLLAAVASAAGAAIPAADDPKAVTEHDVLRARLAFNRRTLAEAYNALGDRNTKWDAPAVKFLDAMAVYFTYSSAARIYRDVAVPSVEACRDLGQAAVDAGCNDPLVTYCRGALLLNMGNRPDADPLIRTSLRGLVERKYPPNRIIAAVARFPEFAPEERRFEPLAWRCAMEVADAGAADELRQKAVTLASVFDPLSEARRLDFCQALASRKTADPWLVELFFGRYEITAAWGIRGDAFDKTSTPAGWKAMADHAVQARVHLARAHELHPEFPEAATEMITVAMAAREDRQNLTPREWFERAVRAQPDYPPAYDKYVYSLYPRWGGSHVDMYKFGIDCLATARFDTGIPYRMWQIVKSIDDDSTRNFDVLTVPEVQVALWQLLTTMSDRAGDQAPKDDFRSLLAAVKWRAGDYAASARLMDKLGDRLDPTAFEQVRGWPTGAISEVRAMTTPHADALAAAAAKGRAGDWAATLAGYKAVEEKLDRAHPGYPFVHERAVVARIQREFAAGGWVSLMPDESFAPWATITGSWRRDPDAAVAGITDVRGATLICRADFGPSYELRARFVPKDPRLPTSPILMVGWTGDAWYSGAGVRTDRTTLYVRTWDGTLESPIGFKPGDRIAVRVTGEQMSVFVNDRPVVANKRLVYMAAGRDVRVGLTINNRSPGKTGRFADVEIRRLETAGADEPAAGRKQN